MYKNDVLSFVLETKADKGGRLDIDRRLQGSCPRLEKQGIGKSILGEEITAYKVGSGDRRVAFFGTHHALEHVTANILYAFVYIMSSVESRHYALRNIDRELLLSKYSYYVIPCVNPDGTELHMHGITENPLAARQRAMSRGDFSEWQSNARGVDLNHNYDFGFAEYKKIEWERGISPGVGLYSGEYPESEPESRAVASFIRALGPSAVVSLHSQGEEIYWQPKENRAERLAKRLASLTAYKCAQPSDTACYGGLCDYVGAIGIPAFTYEVGKGKNPLPQDSAKSIFDRVARSLILLPTLL